MAKKSVFAICVLRRFLDVLSDFDPSVDIVYQKFEKVQQSKFSFVEKSKNSFIFYFT